MIQPASLSLLFFVLKDHIMSRFLTCGISKKGNFIIPSHEAFVITPFPLLYPLLKRAHIVLVDVTEIRFGDIIQPH